MRILMEELQKAVALRNPGQQSNLSSGKMIHDHYEVSPEAAAYIEKIRAYREQAKSVRIGSY